jgi:hypothetical protein
MDMTMIPLEELEVGAAYELEARNIHIGIWDGKEFHGIRYKFGDRFMDSEIHYDLDDHHGTAQAIAKLEIPLDLEIDPQGICPLCGNDDTGTL